MVRGLLVHGPYAKPDWDWRRPREMILSNQRKYYPGIALVAEEETA
jgi:hypothetical protein